MDLVRLCWNVLLVAQELQQSGFRLQDALHELSMKLVGGGRFITRNLEDSDETCG